MLKYVSSVHTCSSSVGIQAVIEEKDLRVYGDTYIKPYEAIERGHGKNILSFLLDKYNFNFDFLTKNEKFLSDYLEENYSRIKHNNYIPVNFDYITNNYNESLMESRENRALKNIKPYYKVKNDDSLSEVEKLLRNPEIQTVSFDLFDTLVLRPFFRPSDLFGLLDDYVYKLTNRFLINFSNIRIYAEKLLRNSNVNEVTLDEIYEEIEKLAPIGEKLLCEIKKKELELELLFINPTIRGKSLYNLAKLLHKKIIIVSDTYFDISTIQLILNKCGYTSINEIFISSECDRQTKVNSGQLFDYVATKLPLLNKKSVLHIGDKNRQDVINAKHQGFSAFRLISNIDILKGNIFLSNILEPKKSLFNSVVSGVVSQRFFNSINLYDKNKAFNDSVYNFGYIVLGPILYSYASWLLCEFKLKKIEHVLFLAREGKLIQKAVDIIGSKSIDSTYLLASRRSLGVASIESVADIIRFANLSYNEKTDIVSLLQNRFGLSNDIIQQKSYLLTKKYLTTKQEDREYFIQVCLAFANEILEISHNERDAYLRYLELKGVNSICNKKIAVVDIGWSCRMQCYLEKILRTKLYGFYYATSAFSEKSVNYYSYACNFENPKFSSNTVFSNRKLVEFLFCSSDKSFKNFVIRNGELFQMFVDEPNYLQRRDFINQLHLGALDFIEKMLPFVEYFRSIPADFAETPLRNTLRLNLLKELPEFSLITFEDNLAGGTTKISSNLTTPSKVYEYSNNSIFVKEANKTNPSKEVKTQVTKSSIVQSKTPKNSIALHLESFLVNHFAKNEKLIEKYNKDRKLYISDSNSVILKILNFFNR